jgi:hypothetical protein
MGSLHQSGGVAWAYRQCVKDRSLLEIEAGTRARKVGSLDIAGAQWPLLGIAQAAGCTSQVAISYCVRPMYLDELLTAMAEREAGHRE